jgi:epoxide hydrolase-like predicted phosphatase
MLALLGRMGKPDPDRETMVEGVRKLRERGIRTALITNNVAEFGDGWRKMIPVDELFEVIIDSSAVGVRKPDPRIFQMALDQLGVTAQDSVFVDDHPGNIRAAEKLGITGVLVGPDRPASLIDLDEALAE